MILRRPMIPADNIDDASPFQATIFGLAAGRRAAQCRAAVVRAKRGQRHPRAPRSKPISARGPPTRKRPRPTGVHRRQAAHPLRQAPYGEPVALDDYVLTSRRYTPGRRGRPSFHNERDPAAPRKPDPDVADFLAAAAEQFQLRATATGERDAPSSGLCAGRRGLRAERDQAVRIYAFETGGNGTYDMQAGLTSTPRRPADLARDRL